MFKYSRRDHTKAAKWDETVSEAEKARRLQEVIAVQEGIAAEINRGLIGHAVEVLVEGPARRREGWLAGKTPQFKTTVFPADTAAPGDLVRVQVSDSTLHTLIAQRSGAGASPASPPAWRSVTPAALCAASGRGRPLPLLSRLQRAHRGMPLRHFASPAGVMWGMVSHHQRYIPR
jgi:hypothetical protein